MTLRARGVEYAPTESDVLWLLRAVEYEGPRREDVARALVNLFVWARSTGKAIGKSLEKTVRAYAQPVNPAWAHGGVRDDDPSDVSAKERRRAAASAATSFGADTWRAVRAALGSGYTGDVTDYAAPGVAAPAGMLRRSADIRGRNTLWTRAPQWGGYEAVRDSHQMVHEIRLLSRSLPEVERAQVHEALQRLAPALVAGGDAEWDLAAANSLEAVYDAVVERLKELGRWTGETAHETADVLERVVSAPARPLTHLLVALGVVLALVYLHRRA